jgi:antitoxin component YwqK of YwqJK toxin-antitoxin module|tara:strand:+ start:115 stop:828 length:714 start_codon:yes stop_codon:yes gene_type:complete
MKKLLLILLLTIPFVGFGQNENTKLYYENGQLQIEVVLENGKGYGKMYHENGQLQGEGKYTDGEKDGVWKEYLENGKLTSETQFNNGNVIYSFYEYYKTGNLEEVVSWLDPDGDPNTSELTIKDRISSKWFYENGQLRDEINYSNGEEDGLKRIYYENGQLQFEVRFKNGKEDGPIKSYHQNGKIWFEGKYVNGEEDGISKEYNKNGGLIREFKNENGVFIYEKCWDEDGNEIECEE